MKKGNLFLIIAHTGQGKTTFVKKNFPFNSSIVFDVNNEYSEYVRDKSGNFDEFLNTVEKTKDKNLIFEEATGFLEGKTSTRMKRIVINKRHTNNNYIFLFHSIADVPPFLFRLANFVVLFKTADILTAVKDKEPKLIQPFLRLQNMPNHSKLILKMI